MSVFLQGFEFEERLSTSQSLLMMLVDPNFHDRISAYGIVMAQNLPTARLVILSIGILGA